MGKESEDSFKLGLLIDQCQQEKYQKFTTEEIESVCESIDSNKEDKSRAPYEASSKRQNFRNSNNHHHGLMKLPTEYQQNESIEIENLLEDMETQSEKKREHTPFFRN